jgi:hypothetical protein
VRTATLDLARDDGERAALVPRVDAHIDEAMDGIGRHVAAQRKVWQRQVISERQTLIRRAAELEYDNDDKIGGLADAHASAAQERARLDGIAPDSPEEAGILHAARSQILRAAIGERIGAAKNAQAVTLFDRVKETLSPADRRALEVPIGVAADDAATDAWLQRESGKNDTPLVDHVALDDGLTDTQRHILRAKIAARESADESRRFATVRRLDDRLAAATAAMATQPSLYRTGALAALAGAYDAAGAAKQAAETRHLALLEPFFRSFAQLGVVAQQRHLETLAGPERATAEAIMNQQADAFARDPYAAGTALYPEVGPPLPEEDAEGRLTQVRMIEARRGIAPPAASPEESVAPRRDANLTPVELSPNEETRRSTSDADGTLVPSDSQIAQGAPHDLAIDAPRRGIGPPTEPPSNDPDIEKAFQEFPGEELLLSNGKWVVDPDSPTGYVMTPFNDLNSVAMAAKRAKEEHPDWDLSKNFGFLDKKTRDELEAVLRANLGHGGTFDYQRRHHAPGKDGLTQLRQFRSIANINVGLFCQQLGLSLEQTLGAAGYYAVKNSRNRNLLNVPYLLDSDTQKYIEIGHQIGTKKLF